MCPVEPETKAVQVVLADVVEVKKPEVRNDKKQTKENASKTRPKLSTTTRTTDSTAGKSPLRQTDIRQFRTTRSKESAALAVVDTRRARAMD